MHAEITELAQKFADCKKRHAEAEEVVKAINEEWLQVEADLIKAMSEEGVKSFDLEGVGRVTVRITKMPNVNAASKPDFFEYLRATGNGGLIKEDVHSKTLQSFLRKHAEEMQKQIVDEGLNEYQAKVLCDLGADEYNGVKVVAGAKFDAMDSAALATEILKAKGASVYDKKDIQLGKGK